jgi:hypothetical protein
MRSNQSVIAVIALVFVMLVVAAIATTFQHGDTRQVSNDVAPGTTGLARPHPPLDRAPGQPVIR